MKTKTHSRNFILVLSILLIPLFLSYLVMPKVRFALNPESHTQARKNVARALYHDHHLTDMQSLWEQRTIIDSGAYELYRTQPSTALTYPHDIQKTMSCLETHTPEARLFAQYTGTHWQSYEFLVPEDGLRRGMKECFGYTGEDIEQDFRSSTQTGLALFLIRTQKTLKDTVGFLDYNETDKKMVGDNMWLSVSHISLK